MYILLNIQKEIIDNLKLNTNSFNAIESTKEARILFDKYYDIKSKKVTSSFNENLWVFKDLISNNNINFNFNGFIPLISFNKEININEFILALKCWTIFNLNNNSPYISFKHLSNLKSICHFTKGLSSDFNDLFEIVRNNQIYSKKNSKSNLYTIKSVTQETTKRYITSLINFNEYYSELPIETEIIDKLTTVSVNLKVTKSSRDLPKPKYILNLKDCIENYYDELVSKSKGNNQADLIAFFPIFLWWELTSIIPMRPSEFCMIKRDCISDKKITFPRLKQKRNTLKTRETFNYDSLPIPNKLIDKIEHYKLLTDPYGLSDKLISFSAYEKLSIKNRKKTVDYENAYFTVKYLQDLINQFYQKVVIGKYKLNVTTQIKPGDLRHISIISLMIQGFDRVEIERLAGHYDINTQYSYVDHMHYWIDTEIQVLSNQFKIQDKNNFTSPLAIEMFDMISDELIYNKLSEHSSKVEDYIELEVGHCKDVTMPCPTFNWNYSGCYFCKNWCISLEELQKKKEQIIDELSYLYNELHRKVNFLAGLYNLHHLDEYGNINSNIQTELKLTTNEIKRDQESIAKINYLLGVKTNE